MQTSSKQFKVLDQLQAYPEPMTQQPQQKDELHESLIVPQVVYTDDNLNDSCYLNDEMNMSKGSISVPPQFFIEQNDNIRVNASSHLQNYGQQQFQIDRAIIMSQKKYEEELNSSKKQKQKISQQKVKNKTAPINVVIEHSSKNKMEQSITLPETNRDIIADLKVIGAGVSHNTQDYKQNAIKQSQNIETNGTPLQNAELQNFDVDIFSDESTNIKMLPKRYSKHTSQNHRSLDREMKQINKVTQKMVDNLRYSKQNIRQSIQAPPDEYGIILNSNPLPPRPKSRATSCKSRKMQTASHRPMSSKVPGRNKLNLGGTGLSKFSIPSQKEIALKSTTSQSRFEKQARRSVGNIHYNFKSNKKGGTDLFHITDQASEATTTKLGVFDKHRGSRNALSNWQPSLSTKSVAASEFKRIQVYDSKQDLERLINQQMLKPTDDKNFNSTQMIQQKFILRKQGTDICPNTVNLAASFDYQMPRFSAGKPVKPPPNLAATGKSTTMSKQSIKIDLASSMDYPVFDGMNSPINIISLSSHAATQKLQQNNYMTQQNSTSNKTRRPFTAKYRKQPRPKSSAIYKTQGSRGVSTLKNTFQQSSTPSKGGTVESQADPQKHFEQIRAQFSHQSTQYPRLRVFGQRQEIIATGQQSSQQYSLQDVYY